MQSLCDLTELKNTALKTPCRLCLPTDRSPEIIHKIRVIYSSNNCVSVCDHIFLHFHILHVAEQVQICFIFCGLGRQIPTVQRIYTIFISRTEFTILQISSPQACTGEVRWLKLKWTLISIYLHKSGVFLLPM
ncbi:hypothetical protein GDO81_006303 [Engystomops pustulosus]|uniref:Uncharacterized protein n=1 Tax=Engystomops pustulosus TaxID=76066 RepID=A0AAV7CW60_ENGPU|nr:hypothetical protein GDO81_006303 [Engystomops pustulosus]